MTQRLSWSAGVEYSNRSLTASSVELGSYFAQFSARGQSQVALAGVVATVVATSLARVQRVAVPVTVVRALAACRQTVQWSPALSSVAAATPNARVDGALGVEVARRHATDFQTHDDDDEDDHGGLSARPRPSTHSPTHSDDSVHYHQKLLLKRELHYFDLSRTCATSCTACSATSSTVQQIHKKLTLIQFGFNRRKS